MQDENSKKYCIKFLHGEWRWISCKKYNEFSKLLND